VNRLFFIKVLSFTVRENSSFPWLSFPGAGQLRAQASSLAEREGISLNHFISLAVTEKVIRMEMGNEHHSSNSHREEVARERR
jgi:hypothetical protein